MNFVYVSLVIIIDFAALVAWGKILHRFDAFTRDKKNEYYLFWFIIAGIFLNLILVEIMYLLWEVLLHGMTGLEFGQSPFVDYFLIVGPVEETTKFLVFITLAGIFSSIKEPRDGLIQAGSVALGFAILENFTYAMDYGLFVLVIRSVINTLGHVTYAMFWGLGWGAYRYSTEPGRKTTDRFFVVPLLLSAIFFHGAYDTLVDSGHFYLAISLNLVTTYIFFLFYRYVRDNSPYRKYRLKEYRKAVPVLRTGLKRYPDSYVLNKRMGIFKMYVRRYNDALNNLNIAVKINPKGLEARYYYGASLFLSGNTEKGMKIMDSVTAGLNKKQEHLLQSKLKKIITNEEDRNRMNDRSVAVKAENLSRPATRAERIRYYRPRRTTTLLQRGYLAAKGKRH